MDDFFAVFVERATLHGLDDTVRRFQGRVPEDELQAWVTEYRRRIRAVRVGYPPKIISAPGLEPWYPGPTDDGRYWPPFPNYLRDEHRWPADRIDKLDQSSNKILAFTHDPSKQRFRTKGLIVGYVQSGKTTNFTAVLAKAADVGYRLIIVLAGTHNGLRKQTQDRLQEQLLQLRSDAWFPLTSSNRDFHTPTVPAAAYFQQHQTGTVICVVKKNQRVLGKLQDWLAPAAQSAAFMNIPVLFIDDEADQASVATPRINPQIRSLLNLFPRCTYLGYTATPFANVLIDPSADDLYPETFILNLPRPEGYFGADRIFGRDAVEGELGGVDLDGYDMVRIVPDETVDRLRPRGRLTDQVFVPEMTGDLLDAVRYFWLATAARRCRKDNGHSTMLVHPSMKTSVHEAFRQPLLDLQTRTSAALQARDAFLTEELRNLWDKESRRVPAELFKNEHVSFDRLLPKLLDVVESTTVVLDNYRSRDRLDYTVNQPVVAIAVGGNTLSRGLTLEGLVVSFFVRAASTYDTLLQMGRWFGYRSDYEDLPRIWMTAQLRSWFRHLATVESEIRLDIERYEEQNLRPVDVGVRIRTHPVLNVTTKMGAARIDYASYGGRRVQTRYFRENDEAWLRAGRSAAEALISAALAEGSPVKERGIGEVVLLDVDVSHILDFLNSYRVHEDSPDLDPRLLRAYIETERRKTPPSLLKWSVAVMGGPVADSDNVVKFSEGLAVGTIHRSKLKDTGGPKADIKTLMTKEHRVVDMDIRPGEARRQSEAKLMDLRTNDPVYGNQGLLLLYPIRKDSPPDKANLGTRRPLNAADHVIGMAIVFPGNAQDAVSNSYVSVDLSNVAVDDSEYAEVDAALTAEDDDPT
ncbi:Z1 domain-containing protein [Nonomuraea polychroma]|uniref:Z1 domain-containing protein n=1 Tax=Nonomuraea polychroma TaxID=46176 RepID=UPI003D9297BC